MLDRLLRRKNGNQELDLVQPVPSTGGTQCPYCPRKVRLNELVRSAHHILGCRYCYGGGV